MRSTLADIAREAGVSSATVDRVLNNRSGVKARTRDIVIETARRLGYFGALKEGGGCVQLDFVLPAGTNTFIANLQQQIEMQASGRDDLDVRVHSVEGFNPYTLATKLNELHGFRRYLRYNLIDV